MKPLVIAANGLRRMMRDRTAMFFVLLLPFFVILIVGSATKQFSGKAVPVGLVSQSSGRLTAGLVSSIEHAKGLRVSRVDDVETLRRLLRRGVYAAGVVVPRDYEARARSGRRVDIAFVADEARPPAEIRAAVAGATARQGALLQAAGFATAHSKRSFEHNLGEARRVARLVPAVGVHTELVGHAGKETYVAGFQYTAASQLVLFVFITAVAGAGVLVANRQQGITRRMYGTPTTATTIVVGELLARFAQALFQALFIVLIGALIFGVDFGSPLAVVALVTMFVLVSASFALLAGTMFRTQEQAGAVGAPLGIAIGMLAGCMWPRFITPPPMQRLGQLFPHAWAVDGFMKLTAGAGVRGIAPELGVLALYVIAILPIATWRLRRSIVA